jgi:hypothetical protein
MKIFISFLVSIIVCLSSYALGIIINYKDTKQDGVFNFVTGLLAIAIFGLIFLVIYFITKEIIST